MKSRPSPAAGFGVYWDTIFENFLDAERDLVELKAFATHVQSVFTDLGNSLNQLNKTIAVLQSNQDLLIKKIEVLEKLTQPPPPVVKPPPTPIPVNPPAKP